MGFPTSYQFGHMDYGVGLLFLFSIIKTVRAKIKEANLVDDAGKKKKKKKQWRRRAIN